MAGILDLYYNNGKGVILGLEALGNYPSDDTYKVIVSKMITSYNNFSSDSNIYY
jgi:hypothetical protein